MDARAGQPNKWLTMTTGKGQAKVRAQLAADAVARDAAYKKKLRHQMRTADIVDQGGYQDEFVQSTAVMDLRCQLRHEGEIIRALRLWTRLIESHERGVSGSAPVLVSEAMYLNCLHKVCLAMTAAPSRAALSAIVATDWRRDSRKRSHISFERFKDALFELADTWCEEVR